MSEKKTDDEQQAEEKPEQPTPRVETPAPPPPVRAPQASDEVKEAAEALLAGVPEHLRDLIPDVGPAEQIKWFRKAEATGVFKPAPVPKTDEGRPRSTPVEPDLSKLPPMARMSRGYGQN